MFDWVEVIVDVFINTITFADGVSAKNLLGVLFGLLAIVLIVAGIFLIFTKGLTVVSSIVLCFSILVSVLTSFFCIASDRKDH